MTLSEAEQELLSALKEYVPTDTELCIIKPNTIEKPYGWIFFVNTCQFMRTKRIGDALIGLGPIVLLKAGYTVHLLPASSPTEEAIQEFEREHSLA